MESPLFGKLSDVINGELQRIDQFRKWQKENLPEFNGEALLRRSTWYLYSDVVAWKFSGTVDTKAWQEVKGFPGYYEPKKRTKAGKEMAERINKARGQQLHRFGFFDIFKTSPQYGCEFIVPNGFIYGNVVYMCFDDVNYKDICEKCAGMFEEITRGEWEKAAHAYNEANR
jgi:hypothetical protein